LKRRVIVDFELFYGNARARAIDGVPTPYFEDWKEYRRRPDYTYDAELAIFYIVNVAEEWARR
jgi:hypothetical protein